MRGGEELWQLSAAEGVAQNAEGAGRIAEAPGRLGRTHPLDEEGTHGFVLALSRGCGLDEEADGFCYVIWCSDRHECTVSHTRPGVKPKLRPQSLDCENTACRSGFHDKRTKYLPRSAALKSGK